MDILKELYKLLVAQPKENEPKSSPPYMPVSVGGITLYRCCRRPNIHDFPHAYHELYCSNCGAKVYGHTTTERATLWNETIKKAKGGIDNDNSSAGRIVYRLRM